MSFPFYSGLFSDGLTDATKGSTVYLTHVRAKIARMLSNRIDDVHCMLTVVCVKDTHPIEIATPLTQNRG